MRHSFTEFSPGILLAELPREVFSTLKRHVADAMESKIPHNQYLAGNIQREYTMSDEAVKYMEQHILPLAIMYEERYKYIYSHKTTETPLPLKLQDLWVNLQSKHEFNPLHDHFGIMSFAIWVQVPYNMEKEKALSGNDSNTNVPGHTIFVYNDGQGRHQVHSVCVDKSMEGFIAMFPATMLHTVYPFFTSDDYRISVAGNLSFKV